MLETKEEKLCVFFAIASLFVLAAVFIPLAIYYAAEVYKKTGNKIYLTIMLIYAGVIIGLGLAAMVG